MRALMTTSAGALVALCMLAAPAMAQAGPDRDPGRLNVQASGAISAAPDKATVTAGVISQGKTAQAAMESQRTAMTGVMDALKAASIDAKDIQTSGISLSPEYPPYSEATGNEPLQISGYMASNEVTVVIRDLNKVGATLDALVAAGANNINGVTFGVTNEAALLDEARKDAISGVRKRAELYAAAGNFKLGRILDMSETQDYWPQPSVMAREFSVAAAPTPIAAGQMTVSVVVNATYEIKD